MIVTPEPLAALIQALSNPDDQRRAGAARDLRALGPAALEALADLAAGRAQPARPKRPTGLLGFSPDPRQLAERARGEAIALLAELDDPRAAEALLAVAAQPSPDALPVMAALALARRRDARAVPLLILALSYPDAQMRGDAAEALGGLGDARAVDPLIQTMRNDGQPVPRWKAMTALGQLGDRRAVPPLVEQLTCLLELPAEDWAPPDTTDFGDQPRQLIWATCTHALEALERLGDPRALPILDRLAREAPARTVGSRAWRVAQQLRPRVDPA
jgi:HEAT repeat protein